MNIEIFDKEAFIDWYCSTNNFSDESTISAFLSKIIGYGLQNKTYSKDQLVYFIRDTIPYINEPAEIAQFCDESYLTSSMVAEVKKLKAGKLYMEGA